MDPAKKFTVILAGVLAIGACTALAAQDLKKTEEPPKLDAPISTEKIAPAENVKAPEAAIAKTAPAENVKAPEAAIAKTAPAENVKAPETAKEDKAPAESAPKSADASVIQADEKIREKEEAESAVPGPAEEPSYKSCVLIKHVILTSDYEVPLLLAESARKGLGIPCLVIPGDSREPDPAVRIAFFTPETKKPLLIPARDLSKFLAYLRARNVILLGNTDYVPAFYRTAVPPASKLIPVTDADWRVNAEKLSSLFQSRKPSAAYRDFLRARAAVLKAKREALEKARKELNKAESELMDAETR